MPSLVIHALIPTLAMLAARRWFDPRVVLYLWPLTLFPDVDYFGANGSWWVHRATLSNVFVVAIVVGAVYVAARRWLGRDAARGWALVALVYLGSHLVMDAFVGGVVAFWPLWDRTFLYWFYIEVDTRTNEPTVYNAPGTHEGAPIVSTTYEWLSPVESAVVAFLLVFWVGLLVAAWWEHRARRRSGGRAP